MAQWGSLGVVDFAVAAARAVAQARLLVLTAVPGDAVDAADPRDVLAPASWSLTAPTGVAPLVSRVVPVEEAPPSTFFLELDAPLVPGASYELGLTASARAAHGEPTSTTTVAFVGLGYGAHTGSRPGEPAADVALPVVAQRGAPAGLPPLEALRARVLLAVRARKGSFTHAPGFGRGVEPKRTYSTARLAQEAAALAQELRADPDVRAAEVRTLKGTHLTSFEVFVEPTQGQPFVVTEPFAAGGES